MKKLIVLTLALIFGGVFFLSNSSTTHAANAADFNPGYIIDDYVFYNSGAMNADQIQNFLNSKDPSCDYDGTQAASDWGYPNLTHAQLAEKIRTTGIPGYNGGNPDSGFHAPPYKCLTRYTQNTPQMEAASGLCGAIPAYTNRSAAQIISDVATACNINPQVLIVLLQKEQTLVTDNWPLNRELQGATGFACPDSAPCDPSYGGFFYQVYYAARQFKIYQAYPNDYNYIAGRNNIIKWSPTTSCGTSQVYIQNQATAALYIYTPYRPNQAALDNLYGTGDGCSSYGNRNFWRIFTDWFGSTKSPAGFNDIIARYNALGGANGALGQATSNLILVKDGLSYQSFENGVITWRQGIGAWETMNGPIRDRWVALGASGGILGSPTGPIVSMSNGATYQTFQNGLVTYSSATGAWESVNGLIRDLWVSLGASGGALGAPIGGRADTGDGRVYQYFQNGAIFWTEDTGAHQVLNGPIRDRWAATGGSLGTLGSPTGPITSMDGGIQYQAFKNGVITWRASTGAWETVNGPIRDRWAALGASGGSLGSPTSAPTTDSDGKQYQYFQNGSITWRQTTGAWESVNGPIRDRWAALGASGGSLGSPTSAIATMSNGVQYQTFQNGLIAYTSATGAWESVNGPIRDKWVSFGASSGSLGSPIGPVVSDSASKSHQDYQHGTITLTQPNTTTVTMH